MAGGKGVLDHDWLPSIERSLRAATVVMAFAGYAALATTHAYSTLILLLPAAVAVLMPLLEWADRHSRAYRLLSTMATLGILVMLPTLFLPLWGLLGAVTALVIYIQVYLMVHEKDERQYGQIFLMNFFLLVTACVQSPEPVIGVIMILFLMSAVFGFLLLQAWAELRHKRAGEEAAHAGAGPAKRSPSRVVIMGAREHGPADQQRGAPRSMAMLGSVLGISLACIALTMALFVAMPRLEAGMLGRSSNLSNITVGLPENVDLLVGGNLQQSGTAVMHVRFPDIPGGQYNGDMLWRSTALDEYTGRGWGRVGAAGQYRLDPGPMAEHSRGHDGGLVRSGWARQSDNPVRQVIYMDNVPSEGVPVLPVVRRISSPTAQFAWDDSRDGTVVLPRGESSNFQYEAYSDTELPSPAALRAAPDDYGNYIPMRDLVYLISQDLLPQTRDLVRTITDGADNPYDKAMAIQAFLQSAEFMYSLQVPSLPQDNPIDHFLHEVRVGHCELYASAMTLMLRSEGIPARVVKGFRGGEWNPEDASYTVLSDMAHLWVEVYFVGHGWVHFDPSPAGDASDLGAIASLNRMLSIAMLRAKMAWYQNVVGFESLWNLEDLRAWRWQSIPELIVPGAQADGPATSLGAWRDYWPTIVGVIGFLFCATILWRSYRDDAADAFRVLLTPDQKRARRLFLRLEEQLRGLGIPDSVQGGSELLEALIDKRAALADDAAVIVRAYQDARFGGRALTRTRYAELNRAVRTLAQAARRPG